MSTIIIPQIYLPAVDDLGAWATIACDQYTSDGAYWQKLESFVGDKPSTLNLIFPEIYLGDNDSQRIVRINENMRAYLASGVFRPYTGLVLVERTTRSGTRTGILLAVDLEEYSFRPASKAPVRSTEATILERIPPRVAIRKDAPIELPHIMLLYDDAYGEVLAAAERIAVAGGAREMTAEASLTARALFESCGYSVRRKQDVVLDGQVLVNFCVSRPLPTVGVPQTEIRPVWKERKRFLDLLLLGDEQESAIDAYLERGRMYLLTTGGESVGVCVVTDEAEGVCEVKNLAVHPAFQRRGYGRRLLRFAEACCRGYARMMQVGTGESPLTLPFYERCGYKVSHRVPRFFLDHYDHPVYDGGHRLVDMIYLRKPL